MYLLHFITNTLLWKYWPEIYSFEQNARYKITEWMEYNFSCQRPTDILIELHTTYQNSQGKWTKSCEQTKSSI